MIEQQPLELLAGATPASRRAAAARRQILAASAALKARRTVVSKSRFSPPCIVRSAPVPGTEKS